MITCFNEKINNFNENNLKSFSSCEEKNSYIQSLMPNITDISRNICPCCHAKNKLIKYGTYERNISILEDDEVNNYRVDLIENIGSGILRILKVYDRNSFIFMDNFLRVSFKYRETPFEYDQETSQETYQKQLNETQDKIIALIKQNPNITQKEMAKMLEISREKVKYHIAILKENNIIIREGSTKKGSWKILG